MKSSAWDNKLWQNKMQELPVTGDGDAAWQKMLGLLDEELPVNHAVAPAKPNLWASRLIKFLVVIIAAAILYFAGLYLLKHHDKNKKQPAKPVKTATANPAEKKADGTANSTSANTLAANGTNVTDVKTKSSAGAVKQDDGIGENSKNNKALARQITYTSKSSLNNGKRSNGPGGQNETNTGVVLAGRGRGITHHPKNGYQRSTGRVHPGVLNQPGNNGDKPRSSYKSGPDPVKAAMVKNNTRLRDAITVNNAGASHVPADSSLSSSKNNSTQKTPDAADKTANDKTDKATVKNKNNPKAAKSPAQVSVFELGLKVGLNTGSGAKNVFGGVVGTFNISQKFGVNIGLNVLTQKPISGTYSNSRYTYTTPDTGNKVITHTADKLTVKSSVTRSTVDVPVTFTYRATKFLSINAGGVIGLPLYTKLPKNTLSPFSNPIDTLAVYKTITNTAYNTTISNKVSFSASAGLSLNFNRFFVEGNYVQGVSPYTISSSLGSTKVYYHSVQVGIGFKIFKSKKKR